MHQHFTLWGKNNQWGEYMFCSSAAVFSCMCRLPCSKTSNYWYEPRHTLVHHPQIWCSHTDAWEESTKTPTSTKSEGSLSTHYLRMKAAVPGQPERLSKDESKNTNTSWSMSTHGRQWTHKSLWLAADLTDCFKWLLLQPASNAVLI